MPNTKNDITKYLTHPIKFIPHLHHCPHPIGSFSYTSHCSSHFLPNRTPISSITLLVGMGQKYRAPLFRQFLPPLCFGTGKDHPHCTGQSPRSQHSNAQFKCTLDSPNSAFN